MNQQARNRATSRRGSLRVCQTDGSCDGGGPTRPATGAHDGGGPAGTQVRTVDLDFTVVACHSGQMRDRGEMVMCNRVRDTTPRRATFDTS